MYVYYNIGEFYKQYNIYMELLISYYRTSKRLKESTVTISYPLCCKAFQRPNIKKKKRNLELVKKLLLQATVYVYEDNYEIQGFIGMNGEYIEGIFVSEAMQSHGIGKILLNYVKDTRSKLLLNVYQKNIPAISFYQREGFEIQYSGLDEATGEKDYVMIWKQK